ncbi:MAG TPA: DUF4142 domain-containing protein [Polyangiales bacterium]
MRKTMNTMMLVSLLCVGCGDDDGNDGDDSRNDAGIDASVGSDSGLDGSTRDAARDATADSTVDAASVLSEAQVVGLAGTINDGEIELGQLAVDKASNSAVQTFAEEMVSMHTAANQRAVALGISRASSASADQVQQMVSSIRSRLQDAERGATFDRAYIDSQVTLHTAALEAFDTKLLPNASTPALLAELTRTRAEVAAHLSAARALTADGGS